MSNLYGKILISEDGEVLIKNDSDLCYLNSERVNDNYVKLTGLPAIRDCVYNECHALLVDINGQLLLANIDDRHGSRLEAYLPPIKRIYRCGNFAILDITNTLTFLDVNYYNKEVNISDITPINNVKTVIQSEDDQLIILTDDKQLIWINSGKLNVQNDIDNIDNIYPEALLKLDGTIHCMRIDEDWHNFEKSLSMFGVSNLKYKVDDCVGLRMSIYTISGGVLRHIDMLKELDYDDESTREDYQGDIISGANNYTRFLVVDDNYLVEDSDNNLYHLPSLKPYQSPIKLMNRDNTPLSLNMPLKNSKTKMM